MERLTCKSLQDLHKEGSASSRQLISGKRKTSWLELLPKSWTLNQAPIFMGKRRKFSPEFRLKAVKEYLKVGSIRGVARSFGIGKSLLELWVTHYRQNGKAGLTKGARQKHSRDFKEHVVQVYENSDLSLRECCLRYKIPTITSLSLWISQFGANATKKPRKQRTPMKQKRSSKKQTTPLTRVEELEKEVLYLRAENALLKKLDALIRQKDGTPKKGQ